MFGDWSILCQSAKGPGSELGLTTIPVTDDEIGEASVC